MNQILHEQPRIVAAAERQMQAWVRTQEIEGRTHRIDRPIRHVKCGPYLALSREAGAGGSVVAQRIGQELGWEVMDRNVLDQLADKFHMPREMLQLHDETQSSWITSLLGSLVDHSLITAEQYVIHLGRLMLAAARRGQVVFVGRGAPFLLPRSGGLSVRIVAPADFRLHRIMHREGLSEADARQKMDKVDRGRADFGNRYFHRDINDPRHYDLVVNTGRLGIDVAADLILVALASFRPG